MRLRTVFFFAVCSSALMFMSCAAAKKRMPQELAEMRSFLTQHEPQQCQKYDYNAKLEIPRLYHEGQVDSILDVIDYVSTECGPNPILDATLLLLTIGEGKFDDTLVGQGTIGQMLWFRAQQDYNLFWGEYHNLNGYGYPTDNTPELYNRFLSHRLAASAAEGAGDNPSAQALAVGFGHSFDSAFALIQKPSMRGSALREAYDDYANTVFRNLKESGHWSIFLGGWNPQGDNRVWGSHPDFGFTLGGESSTWRADWIMSFRTGQSKLPFLVKVKDSLVRTQEFSGFNTGIDAGLKILDRWILATDLFAGVAYDVVTSYEYEESKSKYHGSVNFSVGARQRFFLGPRSGWYIGAVARYSVVDYGNYGGTDLSGNTTTLSFVLGWSGNVTRNEFLRKLNYKGDWRP